MPVNDALLSLPPAPFAGGRGDSSSHYKSDAALREDINLARKVLSNPRWRITDDLKDRIIFWLELVIEASTDDRARVNAIKSVLAADKLNLEQAKLELAAEKMSKPQEVNVNVSGGVAHVFSRLDELEALYAGTQPATKGPVAGNGP